ncbi:hypothetical protein, partial [Lelliottia nimipressuralis]
GKPDREPDGKPDRDADGNANGHTDEDSATLIVTPFRSPLRRADLPLIHKGEALCKMQHA